MFALRRETSLFFWSPERFSIFVREREENISSPTEALDADSFTNKWLWTWCQKVIVNYSVRSASLCISRRSLLVAEGIVRNEVEQFVWQLLTRPERAFFSLQQRLWTAFWKAKDLTFHIKCKKTPFSWVLQFAHLSPFTSTITKTNLSKDPLWADVFPVTVCQFKGQRHLSKEWPLTFVC